MPKSYFSPCRVWGWVAPVLLTGLLISCSPQSKKEEGIYLNVNKGKTIIFGNGEIELEFNSQLRCRVKYSDKHLFLNEVNDTTLPPHYIISEKGAVTDFTADYNDVMVNEITNEFGKGKQLMVKGTNRDAGMEKTLFVELYNNYPNTIVWHAAYANISDQPVQITESVSSYFLLDASLTDKNLKPQEMWSFEGIAYKWGYDYIAPLKIGHSRENFTGLQQESRMSGGTPLIDCWNKQMGLAIAHIEKKPLLLSLPVTVRNSGKTDVSINQSVNLSLLPGERYETIRSTVIPHHLDYFQPLQVYASLMKAQGLSPKEPAPDAYEPFWCSWGYESDFTIENVYGLLPKLKELGIKWVVVDDRWFDRYGDWNPRKETFPGGEKQVKEFVDSLHKEGFLVQLWWAPPLVQPEAPPEGGRWPSATPGASDVVKKHPDWLVRDKQGNYSRCPRNMFFLNGSRPPVQEYIRKLTRRFIEDWGFDGFKLDAFWMAPPSYDTTTSPPELAYEGVPKLMEIIQQTAKAIKPYSVTEVCNCGTPQDFYQTLYIDRPAVHDPITFLQVRLRVKLFKALWGPHSPVFTDHVEHVSTFTDPVVPEIGDTDKSPDDFASTVGTGGVPGTKFTWPNGFQKVQLTPEKEAHWKKWLSFYREKMLSKGDYLNLYDVAYDKPEGHAIQKDGKMYYAFYAADWNGEIELRGLQNKDYEIRDYVNDKVIGRVKGPVAKINYPFKKYLLLECEPIGKQQQ